MTFDAFDGVLPQRRGRGAEGARDEPAGVGLPLERARRLAAAVQTHHGSLTQLVSLERQLAQDLGLELAPGYWTPTHDTHRWALSAIYDGDEFVAFIDLTGAAACALLRLDQPAVSPLPDGADGRAR